VVVDAEEELEKWKREAVPLLVRDMNIVRNANTDMWQTVWALKRAAKRKATPEWSCPVELLLCALAPKYCSVGEKSVAGVGAQNLSGLRDEQYLACYHELNEIMIHAHRSQYVPVAANQTKAVLGKQRWWRTQGPTHRVCLVKGILRCQAEVQGIQKLHELDLATLCACIHKTTQEGVGHADTSLCCIQAGTIGALILCGPQGHEERLRMYEP
jgi:hypothetical protein